MKQIRNHMRDFPFFVPNVSVRSVLKTQHGTELWSSLRIAHADPIFTKFCQISFLKDYLEVQSGANEQPRASV